MKPFNMTKLIIIIFVFLITVFSLSCSNTVSQTTVVISTTKPPETTIAPTTIVEITTIVNQTAESTESSTETTKNDQEKISDPTINISGEESFIDDAILKLKEKGLKVGEKKEVWYELIGAYDGTKIDVEGKTIEIYQYTKAQENAKENALQTMITVDNIVFAVGPFLILIHSNDEDLYNNIKNALE